MQALAAGFGSAGEEDGVPVNETRISGETGRRLRPGNSDTAPSSEGHRARPERAIGAEDPGWMMR